MAAMAGMYLTGDEGFMSMATGTIIVVGAAMIGSLAGLPAAGTAVDPIDVELSNDKTVAVVDVPIGGNGNDGSPTPR
jgi:hypothetical protein